MKAKILLDPERPKVSYEEAKKAILSGGIEVSERNADVGVVIGGDGVFGEFGRSESIPLLLVGVKSRGATGSKAYLATADFEDLGSVMGEIREGRYEVVKFRRLEVAKNGKPLGDVFTDVYVQRGADSNCIRYHLKVKGKGFVIFESAIGDGVVITTRAGSTGYFSYIDKLRSGDWLKMDGYTLIGEEQMGICHILPTYTEREGQAEHPLRYTVPWGSTAELMIDRPADARLFGVGQMREGERISVEDRITISPSSRTTSVIKTTTDAVGKQVP